MHPLFCCSRGVAQMLTVESPVLPVSEYSGKKLRSLYRSMAETSTLQAKYGCVTDGTNAM